MHRRLYKNKLKCLLSKFLKNVWIHSLLSVRTMKEADEDLCFPAAENRGLGTVALGLERAGRSAELDASLSSAPDSLGDPSRPQSSSPTKGQRQRWAIQGLGVFPKKHLPMSPRPHIQDSPSRTVCCSEHLKQPDCSSAGNEKWGRVLTMEPST